MPAGVNGWLVLRAPSENSTLTVKVSLGGQRPEHEEAFLALEGERGGATRPAFELDARDEVVADPLGRSPLDDAVAVVREPEFGGRERHAARRPDGEDDALNRSLLPVLGDLARVERDAADGVAARLDREGVGAGPERAEVEEVFLEDDGLRGEARPAVNDEVHRQVVALPRDGADARDAVAAVVEGEVDARVCPVCGSPDADGGHGRRAG